jgi:cell division protein FtsI (penicillin-binding protein 3)
MAKRAKKNSKKDLMQTAFTRFMLVVAFFVLWIGGISVRLVHLQVSQHGWLKEKALDQRQDEKKTKMLRGTIYDRDGHALAMSVRVKTLFADATEIEDIEAAARDISKVLKVNQTEILSALKEGKETNKRFIPLVKKLDEDTSQKLNKALAKEDVRKADLPLYPGLHWKEDQKRSYPYQSLAAHVIGFSDSDDVGQAGVEKSQDKSLHGAVVKKMQERDRLGRVYDETVSDLNREPPKDVVLTISSSIQYKTEQALEKGVKAANAKSGMAVVMDPKTFEILALANYPTFDPNRINDAAPERMTNNVIQSIYAPGSVFKLVTYGSALEKNLITPENEIDCGNGVIEVAKHRFTDSHHVGRVTYAQALAHSSNVAAIKTGLQVGKEDFYGYARNFGFGKATGVELPGETNGILRPLEKWNGDSLASMSIGYEISVTALQMAAAFATIANDGVRIQPHIVKEIRQSNDQTNPTAEPAKSQIISAQSAGNLRRMLRQVVLTGTGKRAQLEGYTSAGKTGTAWKYDAKLKRVNESKYVSSFIGFAPAENPGVVIAVVMDEPQGGARDGGQVSAPVFRDIAEDILPELGIKPDKGGDSLDSLTAEDIPEAVPGAKTAVTGTRPEKEKTLKAVAEKPAEDKNAAKDDKTKKPAGPNKAVGGTKPAVNDKDRIKAAGKDRKT